MGSELDLLRDALSRADFASIREFAQEKRRTLSYLTALTYDQDQNISWRAVEAFGLVASHVAESDPEYVRVHLRRLVWLLNDESGGIGWRAPECIGEVLRHKPELFSGFIPILVNLMDMEPKDAIHFRAGWLWGITRLAEVDLESARHAQPCVFSYLADPDPQVRGMAVRCLASLGGFLPPEKIDEILADQDHVNLYVSPNLTTIPIAELAEGLFHKPSSEQDVFNG